MLVIASVQQLREMDREISVPFVIFSQDSPHPLHCEKILRLLPGKRITVLAKWKDEQVVAKLFFAEERHQQHAKRDRRGVELMQEANITTPALLAAGPSDVKGIELIVLNYIDQAENFSDLWEKTDQQSKKLYLLKNLIAQVAKQHQAGLCHGDLHFSNFICQADTIYSLDGDAVEQRQAPLAKFASIDNLTGLLAQLSLDDQVLIEKACIHYAELRDWVTSGKLISTFKRCVKSNRKNQLKKQAKKIFRDCSAFSEKTTWRKREVYQREYQGEQLKTLLSDPEVSIDKEQAELIKNGNTATVFSVPLLDDKWIVKRYNVKNLAHYLRRCLRRTRAANSWQYAHHLSRLGVLTAKPLALIEKKLFCFRGGAYFISQQIPGRTLDDHLTRCCQQGIDIKPIAEQTVVLIKKLFSEKISHGDFKASNFIVHEDRVYLIDLDAMQQHRFKFRLKRRFSKDLNRFMRNWKDNQKITQVFNQVLKNREIVV